MNNDGAVCGPVRELRRLRLELAYGRDARALRPAGPSERGVGARRVEVFLKFIPRRAGAGSGAPPREASR